ncbi:MAG TPA: hypothetical protein VLM43_20125, partial [Desulfobacterales bacterium]|nr:hypothetical protein [Desulfobacterales bacterium]
ISPALPSLNHVRNAHRHQPVSNATRHRHIINAHRHCMLIFLGHTGPNDRLVRVNKALFFVRDL